MTFEEITAFAKENEVPKMIGDEDKAILLLLIGEIERYQKREITGKELSLTHQRLKEMCLAVKADGVSRRTAIAAQNRKKVMEVLGYEQP